MFEVTYTKKEYAKGISLWHILYKWRLHAPFLCPRHFSARMVQCFYFSKKSREELLYEYQLERP